MKVIRQLQIKFIISIILIEMIVFALILVSLNFSITKRETNDAKSFLVFLSKNTGRRPMPKRFPAEIPPAQLPNLSLINDIDATSSASRERPEDFLRNLTEFFHVSREKEANLRNYFSVRVGTNGMVKELINDFPINYTMDEIQKFIDIVIGHGEKTGTINGVMYYISAYPHSTDSLICLLNRSSELKTLGKFYIYSALLYILSILISALISIPISKYMVRPAKTALIKQKQFIADASHELKTPIAVIGANIDVLEGEIKENKWLQYIKTENQRMGELVKDLLYLAKNDAGRNELTHSDFDFSNAVENSILPFEVVAFENGKKLTLEVEKNIICNGDEKSLKQIFIILVDNAIKNCESGDVITVRAFTENQKIIYKVHNTGAGIAKEDLDKIFLRFYRSDSSRVRKTGGYGLGLAIATAIAEDHGGTLTADSEFGSWAEFTLTIPRRK